MHGFLWPHRHFLALHGTHLTAKDGNAMLWMHITEKSVHTCQRLPLASLQVILQPGSDVRAPRNLARGQDRLLHGLGTQAARAALAALARGLVRDLALVHHADGSDVTPALDPALDPALARHHLATMVVKDHTLALHLHIANTTVHAADRQAPNRGLGAIHHPKHVKQTISSSFG
eukprot:m.135175 g.135175  ORF g.135175 m.135175 type:complete len:175 (-) comp9882_c1_seq1:2596-3120(-)